MGVGTLWKRLVSDGLMATATVLTVALTLLLLAVGPIYADAVALGAARATVEAAPAEETAVNVSIRVAPDAYSVVDELVDETVADPTIGIASSVRRSTASPSFRLAERRRAEATEIMVFRSIEGLDDHVDVVAGRWPREQVESESPEVALDERIADTLAVGVGDRITVSPTGAGGADVDVDVTALYRVAEPDDRYWAGIDDIVSAGSVSNLFRTYPAVAAADVVAGLSPRLDASWLAEYELGSASLDELAAVRRSVASFERRLTTRLLRSLQDPADSSEFEVDSSLPSLLSATDRSLSVTRSSVFGVVFQLGLLAGYALLLTSTTAIETRSRESALIRVRGARPRDQALLAGLEAVMIVVPLAVAAPYLAAWSLELADDVGPLASIDLNIDPQPNALSFAFAAAGAALAIAVLTAPVLRGARRSERTVGATRESATTASQRAGVDVALLVLTAIVLWQLATLGDERATQIRGRFGVDPLLILAPALGILTAAVIALRIVPLAARAAEAISAKTGGAVGALAGWQIARRPSRYARTALLLIAAVAIGVLALTFTTTWRESQVSQATHEVGADARSQPNRRTGDSITDLQLVAAYEAQDGVERAVAASRWTGVLPGSEQNVEVVAIDADRARGVVRGHDGPTGDAIDDALGELVSRRPEVEAVNLPGRPRAIEAIVDVTEVEFLVDDEPVEPGLATTVDIVLRDGTGTLHRIELGSMAPGDPPTAMSADLTVMVEDIVVSPIPPVEIIAFEAKWATPPIGPRVGAVDIAAIEVSGADGTTITLDGFADQAWTAEVSPLGFVSAAPSTTVTARDDGLTLDIQTGFASPPIAVVASARPTGADATAVPVAVTQSYLSQTESQIGDRISLTGIGRAFESLEIVATVPSFPTVDARDTDALVVDLVTAQLASWGPGESIRPSDEHWLDLAGDSRAVGESLEAAPLEVTAFLALDQRVDDRTTDPPAVGTLGAMSIGFVAAILFATVAFAVSASVSARERAEEFATLRAIGLSQRQLRLWLSLEQTVVAATGIIVGLAIGVATSAFVLPRISLTQSGESVFPPVTVIFPWRSIGLLLAGVALLTAVVIAAVTAQAVRLDRGRVRIGDME